jgi:hypothetical protein
LFHKFRIQTVRWEYVGKQDLVTETNSGRTLFYWIWLALIGWAGFKAAEGRRTPKRRRVAGWLTNDAKRFGVRLPSGALTIAEIFNLRVCPLKKLDFTPPKKVLKSR